MEQLFVNGLCRGASYALLSAGFSMIFLTTRVFHLAYSSTCVFAGYAVYVVVIIFGGPVWVGFLAAIAASAILGVLIEIGLYYPIERSGSSSTSLLLVSLAAAIIIENVLSLLFDARPRALTLPGLPPFGLADVVLTSSQYLPLIAAIVAAPALHLILKKSSAGLLWRAISEKPVSASILGVDVRRVRASTVAIGSAIGGVGFVLHISDIAVSPHAAAQITIISAISAGIARGHPTKAMLVGFIIGFSQSILLLWLPTRWEPVMTSLVLLFAVLLRPDGFRLSTRDDE